MGMVLTTAMALCGVNYIPVNAVNYNDTATKLQTQDSSLKPQTKGCLYRKSEESHPISESVKFSDIF